MHITTLTICAAVLGNMATAAAVPAVNPPQILSDKEIVHEQTDANGEALQERQVCSGLYGCPKGYVCLPITCRIGGCQYGCVKSDV